MPDATSPAFSHRTLGQRVVFDAGRARRHLTAEVERLGADRAMVIAGNAERRIADAVTARVRVALRWTDVAAQVPLRLAERARTAARVNGSDVIIAIGGSSAIDLAKAVALTTRLPIIAVPTTYSGSEATAIWGVNGCGEKTTGVDLGVVPVSVIYDATLTTSLPVEVSVASAFNALAHCVDSMWAPGTDPINQVMAVEGIRALAEGLPKVVDDPLGIDGRSQCLYGAYLAAVALASAGLGLHHKICQVLGGSIDLAHARTHAVVLPHVLAFNAPSAPSAACRIAAALGAGSDTAQAAVDMLQRLRTDTGAPWSLRALGMDEADIPAVAARIARVAPLSNPAPVAEDDLEALLRAAWAGERPGGGSRDERGGVA